MDLVTEFLADFNAVADWLMVTARSLFPAFYGSTLNNVLYKRHMLFILAILPVIMSFCVELIFSFVLSFRLRRLCLYVPFSGQFKQANVRYEMNEKHRFPFIWRNKRLAYSVASKPVYALFQRVPNGYTGSSLFYHSPNAVQSFSPRKWLLAKLHANDKKDEEVDKSKITTVVTDDNGITTKKTIVTDKDGNKTVTVERSGGRTTTRTDIAGKKKHVAVSHADSAGNKKVYHYQYDDDED